MVDVACTVCSDVKDSTFDFYWSGDKRQPYCKECMKKYSRGWGKKHKRNNASILTVTEDHKKRYDKINT
jgi:hypothetical protein